MSLREPRPACPWSTTVPGEDTGSGGRGAALRSRIRYGANVPAGIDRRVFARRQRDRHAALRIQGRAEVECGDACVDAEPDLAAAGGPGRHARLLQRPSRGTADARDAGAADLRDPDRAALTVRAGGPGRERRADDLEPERAPAHAARGSVTRPSRSDARDGAAAPRHRRPHADLPRRAHPRHRPSVSVCTHLRRVASSTPATPVARPCHEPIHGRGVPSNALDARHAGGPGSAPTTRMPPSTPTSPSSAAVRRVRRDARPSRRRFQARGRGRREDALQAASRRRARSRTRPAVAGPCQGSRRNGSSPVVRWKT